MSSTYTRPAYRKAAQERRQDKTRTSRPQSARPATTAGINTTTVPTFDVLSEILSNRLHSARGTPAVSGLPLPLPKPTLGTEIPRRDINMVQQLTTMMNEPAPQPAAQIFDGWGEDEEAAPVEAELVLGIAPCSDIRNHMEQTNIAVSIPVPEGERVPADICCVVDVSGSMGNVAQFEEQVC